MQRDVHIAYAGNEDLCDNFKYDMPKSETRFRLAWGRWLDRLGPLRGPIQEAAGEGDRGPYERPAPPSPARPAPARPHPRPVPAHAPARPAPARPPVRPAPNDLDDRLP
jgi:hypothetical protein